VGEDDALGPAAGAAGVDDLGDVVGSGVRSRHRRRVGVAQRGELVETAQGDTGPLQGGGHPVAVGRVGEHQRGFGVVDQVAQLVGGEPVVQRDDDGAELERPEPGNHPLQGVVADDPDAVARGDPGRGDEVRGGVGPPVQAGVVDGVGAVEHDRGTLRRGLGPVPQAVGHQLGHGQPSGVNRIGSSSTPRTWLGCDTTDAAGSTR
jgi:hypothetical protein